MKCQATNCKLIFSISKRYWNWSALRTNILKGIHPGCLNTTSVRSYGVKIPSETIEQSLSDHNKQRIMKHLKIIKGNKLSGMEEAAVLVPFCLVDNKPSLLFTLRSSSLASHRGQVSFPGGKRDKEDESLVETAVRETVEEIGIQQSQIEVWGSMIPFPDRKRKTAITPVLAFVGDIDVDRLPFNPDEVSEVFHLTLEQALEHRRYTRFKNGFTMPVFVGGPHNIWGLTASIMDMLFEVMFTGKYETIFKFSRNKN